MEEILELYPPITLTTSVRLIQPDEPYLLTNRLGRNVFNALTERVDFEVETRMQKMAPMGYNGDNPTRVNASRFLKPYTLTPPQIFMTDRITASQINDVRSLGMNPINMTDAERGQAYDELIAYKQNELVRMANRRVEWLFAQTLAGAYNYTSPEGRYFEIDFKTPAPLNIHGDYWDNPTNPGNPVHHLRNMAKYFKRINYQMSPDLILFGSNAGDAFQANPHVEAWVKSPGQQLYTIQTNLAKGEMVSLGTLQGMEIFEYGSTYTDDSTGQEMPYIDPNYVYMTASSRWRLYYGAIADLDFGIPPIVRGPRTSKMKITQDGKALDIYLESHPLPVLVSSMAVIRMKVCNNAPYVPNTLP